MTEYLLPICSIIPSGDNVKIGIPKAFLYYRYGSLWETFFHELGCDVLTSEDTCKSILYDGIKSCIDESCIPLKLFMGHVKSLIGQCDYILIPRFEGIERNEEFCVRFHGLYDIVHNTYPEAKIINYNLKAKNQSSELIGFLHMGHVLGKRPEQSYQAYHKGKYVQQLHDLADCETQKKLVDKQDLKILVAGQPYISHDRYIGDPIVRLIREQGGVVLYSDYFDKIECQKRSKKISTDLYWTINKEIIGAIDLYKNQVDGIILLTAFPCGTDSLVNELVLRRVKDVPIIQIVLDEQQALAGLQTRIESFMDILLAGSMAHGS